MRIHQYINQNLQHYLYINLACLSVCLSVSLYPINVKTAEPIRLKFFVGHHVIPGKVYGWSNFQKFASIKIRFLKILKIHEIFFWKSAKFFVFVIWRTPVYFISNKNFYKWIKRWARSALKAWKEGREAPWISSILCSTFFSFFRFYVYWLQTKK